MDRREPQPIDRSAGYEGQGRLLPASRRLARQVPALPVRRMPLCPLRGGTPLGQSRAPTAGEVLMCREVFGDAIDYARVRVFNRKFWFGQPVRMAMAPNGNIYFHPARFLEDFSLAPVLTRAWFIHEMGHVWQHQQGVNVYMAMLQRVYDYTPLVPGRTFEEYGLEQQCEIAADYYLLRHRCRPCWGNHGIEDYEAVLPFAGGPRCHA